MVLSDSQSRSTRQSKQAPPADAGSSKQSTDYVEAPYVGLRPYEPHERGIFFGRDQDAQFLSDKVFASRLTLFYGQSGLGKSSLLRALVIPALEQDDAHVVYFDSWGGKNPTAELKSALIDVASELAIPNPGGGAPTITELVRLIASVDDRTFVLVLDQFEEFLANHGERLNPLKRELAALVRASALDVRTVIALREEFLAALEPFHREILTLYQSTYRLRALSDDAVRRAIGEPAELFGVTYEPELVTLLIDDLHSDKDDATPAEFRAVDLPMLQLVCSQLWTAKGSAETIDTSLYKRQLGGHKLILDNYIRQVMPRSPLRKYTVAQLFNLLAPQSGFKISYSAGDLAQATRLKVDKIYRELKKLSKARILRIRKYRDAERYEVQHDALIGIIQPWRDQVLLYARRLRRASWACGGLFLAILLGGSLYSYLLDEQQDLRRNTYDALEELRSMPDNRSSKLASARFESVAVHLLWLQAGPERLELLRELLVEFEDEMPDTYGIEEWGTSTLHQRSNASEGAHSADNPPWPIVLRVSPQHQLDRDSFMDTWSFRSERLTSDLGIPVPRRIEVLVDDQIDPSTLRIEGPEIEAVTVDAEFFELRDHGLINADSMPPMTLEFFQKFKTEWVPVAHIGFGEIYYAVPRWSLPVWNVSGHRASNISRAYASNLAEKMRAIPETLLPRSAVEFILTRAEMNHPHTVSEARRVRGGRLGKDLAEVVRLIDGIGHLPLVLDVLARHPTLTSTEVAEIVEAEISDSNPDRPTRLTGPQVADDGGAQSARQIRDSTREILGAPTQAEVLAGSQAPANGAEQGNTQAEPLSVALNAAYAEAAGSLPARRSGIWVYLGSDLWERWTENSRPNRLFIDHLGSVREGLWRKHAIEMPDVTIRHNPVLPRKGFRIEIHDSLRALSLDSPIVQTQQETAGAQFIEALASQVEEDRTSLLTVEMVRARLNDVDAPLRDWLEANYTLTDLTLLMRSVLDSSWAGAQRRTRGKTDLPLVASLGETLRDDEGMLGSLVFWSRADDSYDLGLVTRRLNATQASFIQAMAADKYRPESRLIDTGIGQLTKGNPDAAAALFEKALAADRSGAIEQFMQSYSALRADEVSRAARARCTEPIGVEGLSLETRIALEESIEKLDAARQSNAGDVADDLRQQRICLYSAQPADSPPAARQAALRALTTNHAESDDWPIEEATHFALRLLNDYDPVQRRSNEVETAESLLSNALGRMDDEDGRYEVFLEIVQLCSSGGAKQWCWDLSKRLADRFPERLIQLELGWFLSSYERQDQLEYALGLLDRAETNVRRTEMDESTRNWEIDLINYARGRAAAGLAAIGDMDKWADAESKFRSLLGSNAIGDQASVSLISLLVDLGRHDEASALLSNALKKQPENDDLYIELLWVLLHSGNQSGARKVAEELAQPSDSAEPSGGRLFVAALGQLMTGSEAASNTSRKVVASDHIYAPYVTMILAAMRVDDASDEPERLLRDLWGEADSETWEPRMRAGDTGAWREMLLGYYLGEVDRRTLFADLTEQARFDGSHLSKTEMSYSGMRAEAYFYDAMRSLNRGEFADMREKLRRGDRDRPAQLPRVQDGQLPGRNGGGRDFSTAVLNVARRVDPVPDCGHSAGLSEAMPGENPPIIGWM